MLKIGVLGVGHLGKIHVKCIQQTTCFELIGFFDPDDESALQLTNNHNIKYANSDKNYFKKATFFTAV